ncbi:MAG: GNAT family N-acetyltransferase [Candidatus Omnitrophota bacterium]
MSPQIAAFCPAQDFKKLMGDISGKAEILRLQAKGGSMYPFIKSGDWVEAFLVNDKTVLKRGDIILFEKDGYFYAHRLIVKRGEEYIAKGDFSQSADEPVLRKDIIAKIAAVYRKDSRVDLEHPLYRSAAFFLAYFHPLMQIVSLVYEIVCRAVLKALGFFQDLKIFREVIKKYFRPHIAIGEPGQEDAEALRDLYGTGLTDIVEGLRSGQKEGFWLIAKDKERIVSCVALGRVEADDGLWLINGLVVKPLYRGLGIAERLVEAAIGQAQKNGVKKIGLFVSKKNQPAIRLYKKLGFTMSEDHPKEFNLGADEVYLSLVYAKVYGKRCFDKAKIEGVAYPFYKNLPQPMREGLRDVYFSYVACGIAQKEAIGAVLKKLDEAGIETLVLKGPTVDSVIYPDDFYRPRADVDLVIAPEKMKAFENAAASLGYRLYQKKTVHPIPESMSSSMYVADNNAGLALHVHNRVVNNLYLLPRGGPYFAENVFLRETEPFDRYHFIRHFKPEMQLVYLCEHALKHSYDELSLLYEIAEVIKKRGLPDWKIVLAIAEELYFAPFVYYSLFFAEKIFSCGVPQSILEALQPDKFSFFEKKFKEDVLFFRRKKYASLPVYMAQHKDIFKKVYFIFRVLFPAGFSLKAQIIRIKSGL